jgi:hypothetical protein
MSEKDRAGGIIKSAANFEVATTGQKFSMSHKNLVEHNDKKSTELQVVEEKNNFNQIQANSTEVQTKLY